MSKILWKILLATPAIVGTAFATDVNAQTLNNTSPTGAIVTDGSNNTLNQIGAYGAEGKPAGMSQVTSVSQFSDVRPTDWAFQALQSLVERYGCIVGYPDKTYRGNRATTRYEFAAGLNACLDKIQELIAAATADFVRKEDLEVVKRLQEEFAAELSALRGRVESLEVRTATLEKQQFSTTTKLAGEVIFSVADTFGDRATRTGNDLFLGGVNAANEAAAQDDRTETVFQNRVRLALDSSFTGRDRLRVRLEAKNATPFANQNLGANVFPGSATGFTGTNETRLSFDGGSGTGGAADNSVRLDKAYYRFPIGQNLRIQVDANNLEFYDGLISSLSPFESSGQGSVSRFGRFNPIYRSNSPDVVGNAGVTFDFAFSPQLSLQGGFSADRQSNDPGRSNGIFNGDYTAIGQLVFRPSRTIDVGLTYVRSFYPGSNNGFGGNPFNQTAPNVTGSTGTTYASNPFLNEGVATNSFSAQAQWRLTPQITVGGWYTLGFSNNTRNNEEARFATWAGFLGFPDLGKKGNLLGLLFGMTPRVTENDFRARVPGTGVGNPAVRRRLDEDKPLHAEVFYRFRVNDNISITPGAFVLINPEGNSANDTQFVGVVRTTFTF